MTANCINPTTKPGILIWHCGTVKFTAQSTFYGIMYLVNNSDGTCSTAGPPGRAAREPRLRDRRRRGVYGALVADGAGCVLVGSNSLNVKVDPNVFNGVTSFGTVGLVQNTWRELKAGS